MPEVSLLERTAEILHPQVRAWLKEQGDEEPVAVHVVAGVHEGSVETPEALALLIYGFYADAMGESPPSPPPPPVRDAPSGAKAGLGVDFGLLIGAGLVLLGIRHVGDDLSAIAKLLEKGGATMPGAPEILAILQSLQKSAPPGGAPYPGPMPSAEAWGFAAPMDADFPEEDEEVPPEPPEEPSEEPSEA